MEKSVVEFGGIPVGITVKEGGLLRFVAVKFHVIDLDNQKYSSLGELRKAIARHLSAQAPMAA